MASRCPQRLPFMASIRRSTSRSVRCSRDRYSALGLRLGNWRRLYCALFVVRSCHSQVRSGAISISSGWPTVHLTNHLFAVVRRYSDLGALFPSRKRFSPAGIIKELTGTKAP